MREVAELILKHFKGRKDFVAVPLAGKDGKEAFQPFACPDGIKLDWIEKGHLAQKRYMGFYMLTEHDQVSCACLDFDNKPDAPNPKWMEQTEQAYFALCQHGLIPLVERSQSGNGAHVWIFFRHAIPAWIPREFLRLMGEKIGTRFKEIFPKQDRLDKDGGLGNLVRYPLWGQSAFVNVEDGWSVIDPIEAMRDISGADAEELKFIASASGLGELTEPAWRVENGQKLEGSRFRDAGLALSLLNHLGGARIRDYETWLKTGMALHEIDNGQFLLSAWDEWSKKCPEKYEVGACERAWRSFKDKADKVTVGTLVAWAKEDAGSDALSHVMKAFDPTIAPPKEAKSTTEHTTFKDAALAYVDRLERKEELYIPSGVDVLDRSMDGIGKGEMCVITGRPGHGKSCLMFQWLDWAARLGHPCLLISEEMSRLEIGKRRLMSFAPSWGTKDYHLLRDEVNLYHSASAPVFVVENCHSVDRAEEVIDRFCQNHGVVMVGVDYLQLLTTRGDGQYEIVTQISKRLKQAASRNGCALLVACQLNREVEKRKDYEPKNSDLRDSGQIEQDADLIIHAQWPHRFSERIEKSEYRLFGGKRRNGPIRQTRMVCKFDPEHQKLQ